MSPKVPVRPPRRCLSPGGDPAAGRTGVDPRRCRDLTRYQTPASPRLPVARADRPAAVSLRRAGARADLPVARADRPAAVSLRRAGVRADLPVARADRPAAVSLRRAGARADLPVARADRPAAVRVRARAATWCARRRGGGSCRPGRRTRSARRRRGRRPHGRSTARHPRTGCGATAASSRLPSTVRGT
jgi:hypothetical protein